jgi:hypothetical protein
MTVRPVTGRLGAGHRAATGGRYEGITSLNAIADALNERNTPTPGGSGRWHAMQST